MAAAKSIFELKKQWEENNELQAIIVDMSKDAIPNPVAKPDIDDDRKRWLVVGICLHSVISPTLRIFVDPEVQKQYAAAKQTDNIDIQTFPNYMKQFPPSVNKPCALNYEAINNNKNLPKVRRKPDLPNYTFSVQNAVDFSKLFLQTHMAHFTAFDDTCDQSALLGIIGNMGTFSQFVTPVADKVRADVRNPWAHCNFSEWDVIKYQRAFQLMYQLIKNMNLAPQHEVDALAELTKWETNGLNFLRGTTIGFELLQDIKRETQSLAKYCIESGDVYDENFEKLKNAVANVELILDTTVTSVKGLHQAQTDLDKRTNELDKNVKTLYQRTDDINKAQQEAETELKDTQSKLSDVRSTLTDTADELERVKNENTTVKVNVDQISLGLKETKASVDKNRFDMEHITKYLSHTRPHDKPFFYSPNRIQNFVGRDDEIDQLEQDFLSKGNQTHTQVICGLGGTGKTTLSVEFSWRFLHFYPGGVFWMSADNDESLDNCIQRLAIDINTTGADNQETIIRTLRWLSLVQDRWLLVIDNVDVEDLTGIVRELLLGSWKRESKGHIIVTSRREATDAEETFQVCADACITLDVLTTYESMQFLKARTGKNDDMDKPALENLVHELGGLPLALEQAAAHIKSLKCTFQQYLDKFKRKRLTLLKTSKSTHQFATKERLSVRTTWQLNFEYIRQQSEENDLGKAAVSFMEIASFLFADDIPIQLLNVGSPDKINLEDFCDAVQDDLGQMQIMEILTRFSLFQRTHESSLSVHRLVQEVVRESITDENHKLELLQSASRMIQYALNHNTSPNDVLRSQNITRGSLHLWGRLALHANTVKTYTLAFSEKNSECKQQLCFSLETSTLLQTSSIYHSLFQRQDEALAAQAQMLTIITTVDIPDEQRRDLTNITVPLLPKDRLLIENGTAAVTESSEHTQPLDTDTLRQKGNEAFQTERYQNAIQYYTEAVRGSSSNIDPKIYANRSLTYLRNMDFENALKDANTCIQLDPHNWKGYCWKAYAITNLIRLEQLPSSWESVGLAAASVAGHLNNKCLLEYKMKIEYPVLRFQVVENPEELGREISSLMNMAYTTLLLKKGIYSINPDDITTKSVQIIGIEDGVDIHTNQHVVFLRPESSWFLVAYKVPTDIHVHFENVTFIEGSGQLLVRRHVMATFSRCSFSNGYKSCKGFPLCDGKEGCVNTNKDECKKHFQLSKQQRLVSGLVGGAGIVAEAGGNVYLDQCKIDRCGGGGVLCDGDDSFMSLKGCTVTNNRQMGVEARNGGRVIVQNCTISHNQFHGVAIGPRGIGDIRGNSIHDNLEEGIWCGGILDEPSEDRSDTTCITRTDEGSEFKIADNSINKNGMSGISLDGGTYSISGNRIFDNWLWGIMAKSRSAVDISSNDIFENKCGGIRIGINYSASVVIDGNTIKDHSGPAVYAVCTEANEQEVPNMVKKFGEKITSMLLETDGKISDEITVFNRQPIITTRNVFRDNALGIRHPKTMLQLIRACCNCRTSFNSLKTCSTCGKAAYCSRACQRDNWKRHQPICQALSRIYVIEIDMSTTKEIDYWKGIPKDQMIKVRFRKPLPGIGEGVPPSRKSSKKFIVKIQSGMELTRYDPSKAMMLYDKSLGLDIFIVNKHLYHLVNECGELAATTFTTKKMFCWASFKQGGLKLCIHTDSLPEFQAW